MKDRTDAALDAADALCGFIDASPSPRHAAATLAATLDAAGYRRLELTAPRWDLAPGGAYVTRGATVIAWHLRSTTRPRGVLAIGAHTDSPHLRLKPRPAYAAEGCLQLGVEIYGGVLLNSWLDRDLGLAGAVFTADGRGHLLRIALPLARVPQLAIHLDRKVNDDGLKLNPQQHLAPVWGLAAGVDDPARAFTELVAGAAGVPADDIVGHDLSLYDLAAPGRGGAHDELVFAARLDNLASCHAGVTALLDAARRGPDDVLPLVACFDHEEVGSGSTEGAGGPLLAVVIERIVAELGGDRSAYHACIAAGLMASADMAHAAHPNYADRHEPRHKPLLGAGPVLKSNANQRYATAGPGYARMIGLARRADVAVQDFVTRTDLGCGSTIGPITAARVGLAVVDVGGPMLSMHSARECCAAADHGRYVALLTAHLAGDLPA
ncbi:MAG TPA: M18 family aminopeptidase [Kofleriaceae bacterium]|nr:M18 family aminopeptidase [Kofleriaceae bacterium]